MIDLDAHASRVAPALIGSILHGPNGSGRIVETEAYGGLDDPASHAHRGPTGRNRPMFARAGTLYVYLIYGVHHCANVATGPEGDGQAVLIRALEPVGDRTALVAARSTSREVDLTNGPGKLCAALGIDRSHSGIDLLDNDVVRLELRTLHPGAVIGRSVRIGVSTAQDTLWRWFLDDNPWVSRRP